VAPGGEVGIDALLEADEPQLLEMRALDLRERLRELGQRRAAPEGERVAQAGGRGLGVAGRQRCSALVVERPEAREVDGLGLELDHVAGRLRAQDALGQHLAELRDVDLHHLGRRVRDALAPQVVDQALHGDGPVEVQRQAGQQGARLGPAEGERGGVVRCLERAEDP
jgi:hypothetical protein